MCENNHLADYLNTRSYVTFFFFCLFIFLSEKKDRKNFHVNKKIGISLGLRSTVDTI